MTFFLNAILFLVFVNATNGISMQRISTEYVISNPQSLPSCQIVGHRRREREKVLRELAHNLQKKNIHTDLLLKDRYIINKFFFEEALWNDEVVTIVNTWSLTSDLLKELELIGFETFLRLEGDGILWQEKMNFFPDEVTLSWNQEQNTLVTHHTTYYADYCQPRQESQLHWFPREKATPPSTLQQVEQILHSQKEH